MSPATMKMPAAAPTAAPLTSPETFSLSSALASAISSRTSSDAFSRDLLDRLAQLGCLMVRHGLVEDPLEHAREHERAGERDPRDDLRTVQRAGLGGRGLRRTVRRGGRGDCRIGLRAEPGRGHVGAGQLGRLAARAALSCSSLAAAAACSRARVASASACSARSLALRSLRESFSSCFSASTTCVVGLRRLLLGAPRVGLRELGPQLRAARLGRRALGLRVRLARRGGGLGLGRRRAGESSSSGGASHSWVR